MTKPWQKIKITNNRNQLLAGLLKTPAGEGRQNKAFGPKAIVVVCHGFTGSKEGGGSALLMAEELAKMQLATLLFDFAGLGESEGSFRELTLSNQVSDLEAALNWCQNAGYEKIIVTGRSFGASTAIACAAQNSNISALCTWAAVARPAELFLSAMRGNLEGPENEAVRLGQAGDHVYINRKFFLDLKKHDLAEAASLIAPRPFLIIHGLNDESVPFAEANVLFEAAGEPKELKLIEGADHRFTDHRAEVWRVFFTWLNQVLR